MSVLKEDWNCGKISHNKYNYIFIFIDTLYIMVYNNIVVINGITKKGKRHMEELNNTEELVKQTEEKMIYKILLMLEECQDLDAAKDKIKNLIN